MNRLARISRHALPVAVAAALLHMAAGLLLTSPEPYHGGDNATYVALAQGLLEQGRYAEVWDPAGRPVTLYPPVFPLVLAGGLAAGIDGWPQLKLLALCISALAVFVSVLWLHRAADARIAVAGAVLLALSPGILQQADYVLSEGLFWLFTMAALFSIQHVAPVRLFAEEKQGAEAGTGDAKITWVALAGAFAALAALTRSAGLPLIVAIAVVLLVRRRWREAVMFAAISVVPVFAWWVRGQVVGTRGYGSYLTMIDPYQPELGAINAGAFVRRIVVNATSYISEFAPSLLWGAEGILRVAGAALVLSAAVWLLVRIERLGRAGVLETWVVLYAGLLFIWPETWAGDRFVLVLAPAIVWLLGDLLHTAQLRSPHWGGAAAAVTAVFAFGLLTPAWAVRLPVAAECRYAAEMGDPFRCMPSGFGDFMLVADAAGGMLPKGAVVISRKPTLFYSQSGLRSVMHPLSPDPVRFFAAADSAGAGYVVLDRLSPLARLYLHPVISAATGKFCVESAARRGDAVLLRILPVPRMGALGPDDRGFVSMPDCAALR